MYSGLWTKIFNRFESMREKAIPQIGLTEAFFFFFFTAGKLWIVLAELREPSAASRVGFGFREAGRWELRESFPYFYQVFPRGWIFKGSGLNLRPGIQQRRVSQSSRHRGGMGWGWAVLRAEGNAAHRVFPLIFYARYRLSQKHPLGSLYGILNVPGSRLPPLFPFISRLLIP